MNILFIYTSLDVGGVETTIVTFSNWLASQGHDVTLALCEGGDLAPLLPARVRLAWLPRGAGPFRPGALCGSGSPLRGRQFDVVCSFDPQSMWLAALFHRQSGGQARFRTGVYHPRIYFFSPGFSLREALFRVVYDRYVPDRSKFFMNEQCRKWHEVRFGRTFEGSTILPVPIEREAFRPTHRRPKRYRIVSIGRLDAFKTYNVYMLDVLEELLAEGYDVVWDVYGDGGLRAEMLRRIEARGLAGRVSLKGTVPLADIPAVLETAYAFVGMGISMIRAGAQGVPCIPAIGDRGPLSYGYLYDLPHYAVGEALEGEPARRVSDLLRALFEMSAEDYGSECTKTREHCRRFSIDRVGPVLLSVLNGDDPETGVLPRVPSYLFVALYSVVTVQHARARLERAVFRCLRAGLPAGLAIWLRNRRRQRLGRRALKHSGSAAFPQSR